MIMSSGVFTLLFEAENALLQPDDARELLARRVRRVTVKVVEVELGCGSGFRRQWNSETSKFHCLLTSVNQETFIPWLPQAHADRTLPIIRIFVLISSIYTVQ